MPSSNPILQERAFNNMPRVGAGEAMTVNGAINCAAVLLGLVIVGATWTWKLAFTGQDVSAYMMIGIFGGFISVLVASFKKEWAPVLAPVYALLEGFALGGVSAIYAAYYHGIVLEAVGLTFATLASMLLAYRSGLIQVTDKFRMVVFAATGGIALFYLAAMIMGFFHMQMPFMYGSSPISIGISVVVVIVAALNLALDFDFIDRGSAGGLPKYMEWYGALGLMVTLVWLYLEFLRLLSKLNGSRR